MYSILYFTYFGYVAGAVLSGVGCMHMTCIYATYIQDIYADGIVELANVYLMMHSGLVIQ